MVEMGWLPKQPGALNILGLYETAVGHVVGRLSVVVLCMYDLHCLDVERLTTVLRTHQTVFLAGTVLVNPHYRPGDGGETPPRPETRHSAAPPAPGAVGRSRRPQVTRWSSLTESELRIVAHVVAGLTNREMAEVLVVSRHTIDAHLKHIFVKLDIHTRVELTVLALQHAAGD
jgi:DNA-binding CsgD family transcriptional regulator